MDVEAADSESRGDRKRRAQEWLSAAIVLGTAFLLRLWHFREIRLHDPFFELPAVDGAFYHAWAMQLSQGNWLGEGVFYNGPLYPYLLGVVYSIAGPSVASAKMLHIVLGLVACYAVWEAARRLYGAWAACATGLLMATHGMSIFYGGTLLVVNVAVPLAALALTCAVALQSRPSHRLALVTGLVVGLGALARPNMLLFGLALAAWLPLAWREAPRMRRGALTATLLCGIAIAVLPVALRNGLVGGDFVLVTNSGGMNLFMGNHPNANGTYRVPRFFVRASTDDPVEQNRAFAAYAEQVAGTPLRPSQVSAFWRDQALSAIRADPGRWLALELRKLALATNAFEPWNIRSLALSRGFSQVLRLPLVGLGLLLPLATFGAVLAWRNWRALMPIHLLIASVLATLLAFFITARYRLPMVPALCILAGAGLSEGFRAVRAHRWRLLAVAGVLALAIGLNAQRGLVRDDLSIAYYNLGNRYRALRQPDRAVEAYTESLRRRPRYISAINNLALAHEERSAEHDAIEAWRAVLELGSALGSARHVDRAQRHLAALGAEPPPERDGAIGAEGQSDR